MFPFGIGFWFRFRFGIVNWILICDFDLRGWILLTWDSEFGMWDLEVCFGEFVACVWELLITSFQNARLTKQSVAVGGFGNELLHLTFLVHLSRSPRNPPFVFCFGF